jgi:DNA-binding NtrC family response regulator
VRELRNVLERGAVVSQGGVIQAADLGLGTAGAALASAAGGASPSSEPPTLEEVEKRYIADVLARAGGNVTRAARTLGIDRVTLYNKIRKYHLRKDADEEAAVAAVERD